jgi:putative membrane protein
VVVSVAAAAVLAVLAAAAAFPAAAPRGAGENTMNEWSTAGGEQVSGGLWHTVTTIAPWIFAALLLFFVLRALVRQRRYSAVGTLKEEDLRVVRDAIARAERKTVGEILPVVVERSDPHPGANWLAALCCVLVGSALTTAWLPWDSPALVLLSQLAMGAVGFGLAAMLPDFKRLFVFSTRATSVAEEQAFQEFYANGLQKTEAATGVLIFVSLLEHRVIVLADEGINAKVDENFWAETDAVILKGIAGGSLRDGLVAGIDRAGDCLAEFFPWVKGDRNEIPDRIIIRRE